MGPLVGIAVNMLPTLARYVTKGAPPGTEELVTSIVREVLDTDDPDRAAELARDPKVAAELRIRLAEVENEANALKAQAEQEQRSAALEQIRLQIEGDSKERDARLKEIETRIEDTQDARSMLESLADKKSPFAWGPVVVSVVVSVGFFATLLYLIYLLRSPGGTNDSAVVQIVNIAVGALTAGFATVVSFWLGSSDGSRQKDQNAMTSQIATAAMQSENVQATRRLASEQSKQNVALIQEVARQSAAQPLASAPAAAAAPPQKDAEQFSRCVDIIFSKEGGFVDHPDDPGGATNMGITHITLAAWLDREVTVEDVRSLTRETAMEIYRANYWNALNCDNLPAGVDLVVFDFGVNAGTKRAARLLQKVVFVEQDGQIGSITVGAARSLDPKTIINNFSDSRMEHYRSLKHWETFKNGWTRRTTDVRNRALDMVD